MMKTWLISEHGGFEKLLLKDVEKPTPKKGEVLVQVKAVGLNHLDLWVRRGVPGHKFPLPIIPGCDFSGIVEGTGKRVLVSPGFSCGECEYCRSDQDPLCAKYGIYGETCNGGLSEYVSVPEKSLIEIPKELSFEEASSIGIPYVTAWSMLMNKAELKKGQTVLVHAAGSGVSIACIQIAKNLGATVIATVGEDEKIEKAKKLGVDHVIQYRKTPFLEELKKILKPLQLRGVDVVVDHVGEVTFSDSIKALAKGGKLVTCGATTGSDVKIDLKYVFFKNLSILGSTMGSMKDLKELVKLVSSRKLKPVIDQKFDFKDLKKAHEYLESRKAFGKVLIQC